MAMQARALQEGEPASDINTTPLIDVMLVLLVMLIVTLPPQRHAVKLDTPLACPACADAAEAPPEPTRIRVDFDGTISWNGEPISRAVLTQRLKAEARCPIQPEIHVEPNRLAKYGAVAHVMASAQREGLTRLGVVGAGA